MLTARICVEQPVLEAKRSSNNQTPQQSFGTVSAHRQVPRPLYRSQLEVHTELARCSRSEKALEALEWL